MFHSGNLKSEVVAGLSYNANEGGWARGKSPNVTEPEHLVSEVMKQVDQILIKTMSATMSMTNLSDLLALKEDSIGALEDRVDVLGATRREQHFYCPNLFINLDLTAKRGGLAYRTKLLKHNKTMAGCWAYSGRVLIKNPQWRDGVIKEIHTTKDLDNVYRDMPQLDFLVCYTRM